jgi:hypothetical protein
MRRFSIRSLMAFVLISAVGLAALRSANELWAATMLSAALAAVGVAVLGASLMRGRERAWWLGFAVFGGGYLALSVGPWVGDAFRYQLVTTHWLGELRNRMFAPNAAYLLLEKQEIEAELAKLKAVTPKFKYDPVVASLTNNLQAIQAQLTANKNAALRYDPFQRVGHCLLALLAGLVGATVALWFHARRERGEGPGNRWISRRSSIVTPVRRRKGTEQERRGKPRSWR